MSEPSSMDEYLARIAMETVVKRIFNEVYKMELTEEDLDFGYNVSINIIKLGTDVGIDFENYDDFHAVLFRELICATLLAKKYRDELNEHC